MNTQSPLQKPWLALVLLGSAYTLLGWYLYANQFFWLVGSFVVAITLAAAWKSNPLLESLARLVSQKVFVILVAMGISLFIALTLTKPVFLSLIFLPLITLLYALLEMRASNFTQKQVFWYSIIIAGFGLIAGEALDLFLAPVTKF